MFELPTDDDGIQQRTLALHTSYIAYNEKFHPTLYYMEVIKIAISAMSTTDITCACIHTISKAHKKVAEQGYIMFKCQNIAYDLTVLTVIVIPIDLPHVL